jgi:hypothetical protein
MDAGLKDSRRDHHPADHPEAPPLLSAGQPADDDALVPAFECAPPLAKVEFICCGRQPMNYRFNMNDWLPRFPLAPRHVGSYQADIITSPCHLCNNEQLRQELDGSQEWGRSVPVDVFVMAQGEPENRYATKIAGLPYRPANLGWPLDEAGDPLLFLAQFNFLDSRDIVPDLPNELLLIFIGNDGSLRFEWQPLGLEERTDGSDVTSTVSVRTTFSASGRGSDRSRPRRCRIPDQGTGPGRIRTAVLHPLSVRRGLSNWYLANARVRLRDGKRCSHVGSPI